MHLVEVICASSEEPAVASGAKPGEVSEIANDDSLVLCSAGGCSPLSCAEATVALSYRDSASWKMIEQR